MSKKTLKIIGITGVMGAGKSSVIEIIKQLGYTVIDCDRINGTLLEPKERGYCALLKQFGNSILDEYGKIERKKMSDYIFANENNKQIAEAILHPLIKEEIIRQIQYHQSEYKVFVEVPLLYEVKWEDFFDEVWVVASNEELLLKRLMEFRGFDKQEAKRRLSHQMSQEEKVIKANYVIWNNLDKEHLKQQICDILVSIRSVEL